MVLSVRGDHRAHHGRIGGREDHPLFAVVERGQRALQRNVLCVGARDEPHRTGTGAHRTRSNLLGLDDLGVEAEPEVGVGVHADERLAALALQQKARALPVSRRDHLADDHFGTLGGALLLHSGHESLDHGDQAIHRHCRRYLPAEPASTRVICELNPRNMSATMSGSSYRCLHPHCSRASESSSRAGHESAMDCRRGSGL